MTNVHGPFAVTLSVHLVQPDYMISMPRMARLVIPGYPHHVMQRGSRRQATFFRNSDYRAYLTLLGENAPKAKVEVWAYCLMPNHVHIVAVPKETDGLARLLHATHHRYARLINDRFGWRGHLWQERFRSFVMDETYLLAAARYVELNPVRAGLCDRPDQWRWSSVHAHLHGGGDAVVNPAPLCKLVSDWPAYLAAPDHGPSNDDLRRHTNSGRPAGDESFVARLEALTGRRLRKLRPGPRREVQVTVP